MKFTMPSFFMSVFVAGSFICCNGSSENRPAPTAPNNSVEQAPNDKPTQQIPAASGSAETATGTCEYTVAAEKAACDEFTADLGSVDDWVSSCKPAMAVLPPSPCAAADFAKDRQYCDGGVCYCSDSSSSQASANAKFPATCDRTKAIGSCSFKAAHGLMTTVFFTGTVAARQAACAMKNGTWNL